MKRYGNLFDKITDIENIKLAHKHARKGKTKYRMVRRVDADVDGYCNRIKQMLEDKTYTTSRYRIFPIYDRGKEREICDLPYYPDRIVHWALMQVIEPIFLHSLIPQTYAALPKRGTHKALKKLHSYMRDREGTEYCLKLDVKKFFPNLGKAVLKAIIRKKIKCKDTLWLIDDIIDSYGNGLPIGNYTSQYFGNMGLYAFDHWIKEQMKAKYYLRYMDDLIILNGSKEHLHALRKEIEKYLREKLGLELKGNWQVFPSYVRGVDFVGYRSFGDYTLLRNGTKKRLKTATKTVICHIKNNTYSDSDRSVLGSYNGILKWCDGYRLSEKTINVARRLLNESQRNTGAEAGVNRVQC